MTATHLSIGAATVVIAPRTVTVDYKGETRVIDITPGQTVAMRGRPLPDWARQVGETGTLRCDFGFRGSIEVRNDEVKVRHRFWGWQNFVFDTYSPFFDKSYSEVADLIWSGPRLDSKQSNLSLAWDNILNNSEWQHGDVWLKLGQTIVMAFAGTLFASILAFPLSFIAARNCSKSSPRCQLSLIRSLQSRCAASSNTRCALEDLSKVEDCAMTSPVSNAHFKALSLIAVSALALSSAGLGARAADRAPHGAGSAATIDGTLVPTGKRITPEAMPGSSFGTLNPNLADLPDFTAGQASALALSPDGKTLLVLTSGYNRNVGADGKPIANLSNEYVFVYDVAGPLPVKQQVLQVPNTFQGIVWHPGGGRFFVAGGVDDVVYDYAETDGRYALDGKIALGHSAGVGLDVKPEAAGLAVSPDGKRLLVANYQNESVSLIDTDGRMVVTETDLRPGLIDPARRGTPGGTYPNQLAFVSPTKAYVTSQRDRELIALAISGDAMRVSGRAQVEGQPSALVLNGHKSRAYVALDNTDRVIAIDTTTDRVLETIVATAPKEVFRNPEGLRGANTNALALSTDGRMLFASDGGLNAVAVIALGEKAVDPAVAKTAATTTMDDDGDEEVKTSGLSETSKVVGLLPTGWYPTAVALSPVGRPDGQRIFVANGKSNAGPNPLGCRDTVSIAQDALNACKDSDQYVWQLEKGGLLTLPMPSPRLLADMTWQVAANNAFPSVAHRDRLSEVMAVVRQKIDHVIYIVKENRTYDQILGDLEVGNGDPSLAILPQPITPNHHALAKNFVTLDGFFDSGESSNTGWNWTTAARTTDFTERTSPVNYAGRGLQYDWEGTNRGVNVGLKTLSERKAANPATPGDEDVMAGTADVAAPDAPEAAEAGLVGTGYLWDAALRAGLSVRNYGFYGDLSRYDAENPAALPATLRDPFAAKTPVFFPTKASLAPHSDIYFRGYDQKFPDYWRVEEWRREFEQYAKAGSLPNLTLLRLPHDHFGDFDKAVDGVDTVETQMADNDYAIGRVVETVAKSRFAASTLIFIIEDDAQNGADHVDPHRSIALVAGPMVRQNTAVSEHFTTVAMLRTIEEVLDLPPLGLNDGLAEPMAAIFDPDQTAWSYDAIVPQVLKTTQLPMARHDGGAAPKKAELKGDAADCFATPARDAAYWTEAMKGQDFQEEDRLDTARFNAALWTGLKGDKASQPDPQRGIDLSQDREARIAAFRKTQGCEG